MTPCIVFNWPETSTRAFSQKITDFKRGSSRLSTYNIHLFYFSKTLLKCAIDCMKLWCLHLLTTAIFHASKLMPAPWVVFIYITLQKRNFLRSAQMTKSIMKSESISFFVGSLKVRPSAHPPGIKKKSAVSRVVDTGKRSRRNWSKSLLSCRKAGL